MFGLWEMFRKKRKVFATLLWGAQLAEVQPFVQLVAVKLDHLHLRISGSITFQST